MLRLSLLCLLALTTFSPPATAQRERRELPRQARDRGHRMLRNLRDELLQHYYDTTYHGVDIAQSYLRADSAIDKTTTLPEMMGVLAQFLGDLNDSHTRFDPPTVSVSVQYGWRWQTIGDDCYVVAVKEGTDADDEGLRVGDRVLAIDGIRPTRQNLSTISYVYYRLSPRPGMRLVVEHADGEQEELLFRSETTRGRPVVDLNDLEERRRIRESWQRTRARHRTVTFGDSVLVWHMPGFMFEDENVDRIMRQARDHSILILDLRGNGGGSVATELRLIGHFFDREVLVATAQTRGGSEEFRAEPVGDEPFTGETIVLIDSESGSAAEITARILQLEGRATIVGDRSAGAVMTSIYRTLRTGSTTRFFEYGMSVTISDVIMPDGKSLEHAGVIPNIAVLPTPQDLVEKRDPAMAFALELAGVAMSAADAARIYRR